MKYKQPKKIVKNKKRTPKKKGKPRKWVKGGKGRPPVNLAPPEDGNDYKIPQRKRYATYSPGRPTEYKPEYCQYLYEHLAEGLSFESFGACVAVGARTLYDWANLHEDFMHAKITGTEAGRVWWESLSQRNARTNLGSTSAIAFNMKNRFRKEWTDQSAVDITTNGKDINEHIDLTKVSDDTLRRLLKEAEGK